MGRKMTSWRTLVGKVHKPMCSFGRHKVGTKFAHQLVSRFVVDKSKRIAGSSALPMKAGKPNLVIESERCGSCELRRAGTSVSGYFH